MAPPPTSGARVVLNQSFDMSAWDLSDLAGATVVKDTSSRDALVSATAEYIYNGVGLTLDGTTHQPTGGTVTSLGMWEPAAVPHSNVFQILNLNADYVTINSYVQAHDTAGLEAFLFSGNDRFVGSNGNDVLLGYDGDDNFVLTKGGSDTVDGGAGDDTINMGATLDASDRLDGGAGYDTLNLNGTTNVTFDALTIQNIEKITLHAGSSYSLTLDAGNLSAGQMLTIVGRTLHSTDSMTVDGSAITDGNLVLVGGDGDDLLIGGQTSTTFKLVGGGADTVTGGVGDDKFLADDHFTAADVLTGGGGDDVLSLAGYAASGAGIAADPVTGVNSLTFEPGTLTGIGTIKLVAGFDYDLVLTNDAVAPGATLTIDGSNLCGCHITSFDGSAVDNGGMLHIIGGSGNDFMAGGTGNDTLDGGGGDDMVSYAHAAAGVSVDLNLEGTSQDTGSMGRDTLISVESVQGSAFDDLLIGNRSDNYFDPGVGSDTVMGGRGDDTIDMGANLDASDSIDGGKGFDTLLLGGDYSAGLTIGSSIGGIDVTGIENLRFDPGFSYHVTVGDGITDNHRTELRVGATDPNDPDPGISEYIDGSAMHGPLILIGSANADTLIGGAGDNLFYGSGGADTMVAGEAGSSSLFFYNGISSQSTSTTFDTIIGFDGLNDGFENLAVNAVDTPVTTGSLSLASFDTDLAAAIGNAQLGSGDAVLFTPDAGGFAGDTFVIVDLNGTTGYQASADLVIYLQAPTHIGFFDLHNFTP